MIHKVVARYIDGRVVKGVSSDINPKRPFCHIRTENGKESVKLLDLKALFFVKDLVGDAKREDGDALESGDPRQPGSRHIEVEFGDGERVVGLTVGYPPQGPFFYMLPADNQSNNVRILVNQAAIARMTDGRSPANDAAQKVSVREARLKPEYAAEYPELAPGVWTSAMDLSKVLIERARSRRQENRYIRTFDPAHFEFRGGDTGPRPRISRTRSTDLKRSIKGNA